jgi:DnaJ-class molecular chaperone
MSEPEIEADIRNDTVWQRPSWPLGSSERAGPFQNHSIDDPFGVFGGHERPASPRPPTPEEQAMDLLDLTPPVTVAIVKARYKELVKRHHPDANGGDKAAEERFKQINQAYRTVMSSLVP